MEVHKSKLTETTGEIAVERTAAACGEP